MTTAATFHHQRPMASTSYLPPAPAMNGHVEHSAAASAEDDSKISAFCALEFPYYNFYIKTRSVTIGRLAPMVVPAAHCTANPSRASPAISTKAVTAENSFISPRLQPVSATRSTSAGPTEAKDEPMEPESVVEKKARSRSVTPSDPPPAYSAQAPLQKAKMEQELQSVPPSEDPNVHVDVDLGPIKAVSRDHARCFFHNGWNCWALEVRGRNGLVVEGRWRAKGDVIALTHRSAFQEVHTLRKLMSSYVEPRYKSLNTFSTLCCLILSFVNQRVNHRFTPAKNRRRTVKSRFLTKKTWNQSLMGQPKLLLVYQTSVSLMITKLSFSNSIQPLLPIRRKLSQMARHKSLLVYLLIAHHL